MLCCVLLSWLLPSAHGADDVVIGTAVNFRSEASTSGEALAHLPYGAPIAIERRQRGWVCGRVGSTRGCIASRFVTSRAEAVFYPSAIGEIEARRQGRLAPRVEADRLVSLRDARPDLQAVPRNLKREQELLEREALLFGLDPKVAVYAVEILDARARKEGIYATTPIEILSTVYALPPSTSSATSTPAEPAPLSDDRQRSLPPPGPATPAPALGIVEAVAEEGRYALGWSRIPHPVGRRAATPRAGSGGFWASGRPLFLEILRAHGDRSGDGARLERRNGGFVAEVAGFAFAAVGRKGIVEAHRGSVIYEEGRVYLEGVTPPLDALSVVLIGAPAAWTGDKAALASGDRTLVGGASGRSRMPTLELDIGADGALDAIVSEEACPDEAGDSHDWVVHLPNGRGWTARVQSRSWCLP